MHRYGLLLIAAAAVSLLAAISLSLRTKTQVDITTAEVTAVSFRPPAGVFAALHQKEPPVPEFANGGERSREIRVHGKRTRLVARVQNVPCDAIALRRVARIRERHERAERVAEHTRRKLGCAMAHEAQSGADDIIHADVAEPVRRRAAVDVTSSAEPVAAGARGSGSRACRRA